MEKKDIKAQKVLRFFDQIMRVPRPSKHEEAMSAWLAAFGRERGLATTVDAVGNVLIRKPAAPGREAAPAICLQAHMDMVWDSVAPKDDHLVEAYVDGDWLRARGTTLGADDGIGVAIMLEVLDSTDVAHGPLECLFTVDEETGLTGANAFDATQLQATMLLNLDSEDEGVFFNSCAGGRTTTATWRYGSEASDPSLFYLIISVSGLAGGHSGDDIDKGRANAIRLLARFLYQEQQQRPLRLVAIDGGRLHNAIPRQAQATFAVPFADKEAVRVDWNVFCAAVEGEYRHTDAAPVWHMGTADAAPLMPADVSRRVVAALTALPNGPLHTAATRVDTSSNLAVVATEPGTLHITTSQRSNTMSRLTEVLHAVQATLQLAQADDITHSDGYPAWQPRDDSQLTDTARQCYQRLFGTEPTVRGIHAGLECGLFAGKRPDLDMLSLGPTMRGVHSPDERLYLPSVPRTYELVTEILVRLKLKA